MDWGTAYGGWCGVVEMEVRAIDGVLGARWCSSEVT